MHKADRETPSSFLALTVGIFIGAMLVLPMFAYVCRVNWQLRQENQRLRVQTAQQNHVVGQNRELREVLRNLQLSMMYHGPAKIEPQAEFISCGPPSATQIKRYKLTHPGWRGTR